MRVVRRRMTAAAGFALLALLTELTGRSMTIRLDRAFNVTPFATPTTSYYPFLLAGVRALAALVLAAAAWRLIRAHATAAGAERLLRAVGSRNAPRRPQQRRTRVTLTSRLWLVSFTATSLWYLVQTDADRLAQGRWPLLAPWLHTYALPVFAVLAVLLAVGWSAVRDWLADVEQYAAATLAHVCRILRGRRGAPQARPSQPGVRAPRRLFGIAFESRPPPHFA